MGTGDSCFNPGMQSITKASGNHLGVYSTCIPTGGNWITDTIGGFLKNMDASVEFFAKKVRSSVYALTSLTSVVPTACSCMRSQRAAERVLENQSHGHRNKEIAA